MAGNFYPSLKLIGIEDHCFVMLPDGKMKNPQRRSPVPYFCLWRISLHEVPLGIADLAESVHKSLFSADQQSFFQTSSLGFRVSWES